MILKGFYFNYDNVFVSVKQVFFNMAVNMVKTMLLFAVNFGSRPNLCLNDDKNYVKTPLAPTINQITEIGSS